MPQLFEDPSHPQSFPAFGPYRVLHQIGSGVLGPVFRSTHPITHQPVVVKAFKLDMLPEQAARFAEALRSQLGAQPTHPGLVPVLDIGLASSTAFIVLDAVAGETLDVVMRRSGPIRPEAALAILSPLSEAMDVAHAAGLLHGALHPRDILIHGASGAPSMSGWGLSAALDAAGVPPPTRRAYAAPERLGGAWDARADIFALAALGLELMTGRRPGAPVEADMAFAEGVDEGQRAAMREILARGMAERTEDRFETAAAMTAAIRQALGPSEHSDPAAAAGHRAPFVVSALEDRDGTASTAPAGEVDASGAEDVAGDERFQQADGLASRPTAGGNEAGPPRGARGVRRWAALGTAAVLILLTASLFIWPRSAREDSPDSWDPPTPSVSETEVAVAEPIPAARQGAADEPAEGTALVAGPLPIGPDVMPASRRVSAGRLVIRSVPSGAMVTLDGRLIGETPAVVSDLPLGDHSVLVARPGFVPRDQTVRLSSARPSQIVSVALQPGVAPAVSRVGAVFVDSRPRGARVFVDGRAVGTTPVLVPALAAGTRVVRVRLPGFVTLTARVDIRSNEEARLAVTLERQRLGAVALSSVFVRRSER